MISLIPRSAAICLFSRPVTTKLITSRSRGLRTLVAELEFRQLFLIFQPPTVPRVAKRNRIKEVLITKRLRQKLDCPAFHRLDRHGNIAIAGNEDDRQLPLGSMRELALQIESTFPRHPDIEDQTNGAFPQIHLHELSDRRKQLALDAEGPTEPSQCFSYVRIIIDDNHARGLA